MKDRLEKVMQHHAVNASEFANATGVKRSALTHVLSGRNQPGIGFLQKVLEAFPNVNGDWLLTGNGQMLKSGEQELDQADNDKANASNNQQLSDNALGAASAGKVKKIIVFYTDNHYEEFNPNA